MQLMRSSHAVSSAEAERLVLHLKYQTRVAISVPSMWALSNLRIGWANASHAAF